MNSFKVKFEGKPLDTQTDIRYEYIKKEKGIVKSRYEVLNKRKDIKKQLLNKLTE